ncbi:MAG TPA: uroporphyrinogen decarboxylase [Gammaproteobacteria bacterium]|nr:uroporphyrinogen decarboxylase [Gammaproteobacteria bacterium]
MIKLKNDRLIRAIRQEPVDMTPVWIMRQAGRYLPEYREVRKQAGSFLKLCKTPELACEVTLQPLNRFPLDAAILFSDILTIPDAMGLGLRFVEGEGPQFDKPIRSVHDLTALGVPDPEIHLRYVLDAVRLIRQELAGKVPLIGFCGSPWTLATYMLEGRADKSFPTVHAVLREQPRFLHALLDILARSVAEHLNAQIRAGVQVVMIFDTWGGLLNTEQYQDYSLRYIQQIISLLLREYEGESIPLILFTKNGAEWLESMANSGCDALGVDWQVNLGKARERVGGKVALQGNMDPALLLYQAPDIQKEVARILSEFGQGSGHIFNLGHGITPDVPPENVAVLVDTVHTLSRPYHE